MNSKSIIKILVALYSIVIVFHICIVLKIIPYSITWGGRLKNDGEMYVFETLSIVINLLLSWVLLMKGDFVRFKFFTQSDTYNFMDFCVRFYLKYDWQYPCKNRY